MSVSETDLLEGEERTLEAAEALVRAGALEPRAEAFAELTRQYARLLRHVRSLIKVSDRMQVERNQLNDRLRESEEKYRLLFESVSEGIFIARLDGRFLDVNLALACILGYETPAGFLRSQEDDPVRPFLDDVERERFLSALAAQGVVSHLQLQMVRRDGVVIWVETNARVRPPYPRHPDAKVEGVLSDITERKRMLEELRYLAVTDSLTGLHNRRHFLELCERELCRARRYRLEIALLMLDADEFKPINDTYGHDMGDEALRWIARLCQAHLRQVDVLGRLGGEEFAVLLPQTGLQDACEVAERLRRAIAQAALPLTDGRVLRFTVSIGVCAFAAQTVVLQDLLKAADQALYAAKRNGRNQVASCPDRSAPDSAPV